MRVVALRRNAGKPDEGGDVDLVLGPYEGAIQPAHKRALLEQSDVVVCSLPGTAETRHFLSTQEFGAMKDDAVFISLGRGVVLDPNPNPNPNPSPNPNPNPNPNP